MKPHRGGREQPGSLPVGDCYIVVGGNGLCGHPRHDQVGVARIENDESRASFNLLSTRKGEVYQNQVTGLVVGRRRHRYRHSL